MSFDGYHSPYLQEGTGMIDVSHPTGHKTGPELTMGHWVMVNKSG